MNVPSSKSMPAKSTHCMNARTHAFIPCLLQVELSNATYKQALSGLKYEGVMKEQINEQGLDLLLGIYLTRFKLSELLASIFGEIPLGAFIPELLCDITLLQHGLRKINSLNMSSLTIESLKRISLTSIQVRVNVLPIKSLRLEVLKTITCSHLTAEGQEKMTPKRRLADNVPPPRDKYGKLIPTKCCDQTGFVYKCFNKCRSVHWEVSKSDCAKIPKCQSGCRKCLPRATTSPTTTTPTTTTKITTATTITTTKTTTTTTGTTASTCETLTDTMLLKLTIGDINLQLLTLTAADIDVAILATLGLSELPVAVLTKINLCDFPEEARARMKVEDVVPALGNAYTADCYLRITKVHPDGVQFDHGDCTSKASDYLCQPIAPGTSQLRVRVVKLIVNLADCSCLFATLSIEAVNPLFTNMHTHCIKMLAMESRASSGAVESSKRTK